MMLMPARQDVAAEAPSNWQQLPHGRWLQEQLSQALTPHCAKVFGYYLARVGHLAQDLELGELRVRHQFSAARYGCGDIHTDFEYWPFAEGVLDAIVMIGQLEFERDPHQVLREVSRSLIADGHLVLACFNPMSPSLLTGLWPGHLKQAPWSGRYFSRARIYDWLSLLNFEVIGSGYVAPSLLIDKLQRPDFALARVAKVIPQLSSMFYIVARKREFPLTVVRVRKRIKPRMSSLPVAQRTMIKTESES